MEVPEIAHWLAGNSGTADDSTDVCDESGGDGTEANESGVASYGEAGRIRRYGGVADMGEVQVCAGEDKGAACRSHAAGGDGYTDA